MTDLFLKKNIHYQLPVSELVMQTLEKGEGKLNDTGALLITTGRFTGRSPEDKFIVKDTITACSVDWNKFNNPIRPDGFARLKEDVITYLGGREEIWVRDVFACADEQYRLWLRVTSESSAANHFAANMFISPGENELLPQGAGWDVIHAPGFQADPARHGTKNRNFTAISFSDRTILIGGTGYTGEIKKSVFTVLNYLLPLRKQVLPMHCSANIGAAGDTALFFGLSGTGKTTLSSDPERQLIGDDEHGWDRRGVFNFEGGCYAKTIDLAEEGEPEIYRAIRAGALVENAVFFPGSNRIDFGSRAITENTRVSYPLGYIENAQVPAIGGAPENIFFLSCDAHGVLPPISKLTPEQAMFYYLNGYTAKVAGTELGIDEPKTTFSTCFGAPFLPLPPVSYAAMFKSKIEQSGAQVWLINTGWTGGPYGTGHRISLGYTRAMIRAVLGGCLANVDFDCHPVFKLSIPKVCPEVPSDILNPRCTWADSSVYDMAANSLMQKLLENHQQYQPVHG